ncbi:MAG: Permease of the drug/metabolite transporter superfamily [Acidobacteriaceae bacterium]|jgi:drug/metabolite transporter (DMT)-like permease|nr:Permease of the drug/metabolite transporter superfamily [Acidobacteriaceae bacterium]
MSGITRPARWKILCAFFIIYFVWGSTYLGIRVGVHEVPPFLLAAIRFTFAGLVLYAWMRLKGTPAPSLKEWKGAFFLGTLMFLVDYGSLFWAEQRVPSGIAAVILASIPLFITLLEIIFLRTQRLTVRLAVGLLVGLLGVSVLMAKSVSLGEASLDRVGVCAILVAAVGWSVGTILTRKLTLPASKPMSAAAQMLLGGLQLFVLTAVSGEFSGFHLLNVSPLAWFALVYLIVFGSLIGFTAYVWLLHYESPTMVGTYAYVNPVVAVAVGYFLGGETVGPRTILGTLLVLASVLMITMMPGKRREATPEPSDEALRTASA